MVEYNTFVIESVEEVEMPIYEYQCSVCNHQFESVQKMSEDPLKNCPVCHKDTLNKLISASGFQLKGTGWYATDFRTKKPSDSKKDSQDASTDSKAKSGSSGEATT